MCMTWPLAQSGMGADTVNIGLTVPEEGTGAQEEAGPEAGDC